MMTDCGGGCEGGKYKLMCKGHAALSLSVGLYYSIPVLRPLSPEVSCLPVSTPGLYGPWMPFQELEMGLGQPLSSSALTHRVPYHW